MPFRESSTCSNRRPRPTAASTSRTDWLVLHHVFPADRPRYVANVHRMLRPGGLYLSVCFSEDDRAIAGEGKCRQPQLGTLLYLSSEQEIRELFEPSFDVEELATVEIEGKRAAHMAVRALMEEARLSGCDNLRSKGGRPYYAELVVPRLPQRSGRRQADQHPVGSSGPHPAWIPRRVAHQHEPESSINWAAQGDKVTLPGWVMDDHVALLP